MLSLIFKMGGREQVLKFFQYIMDMSNKISLNAQNLYSKVSHLANSAERARQAEEQAMGHQYCGETSN